VGQGEAELLCLRRVTSLERGRALAGDRLARRQPQDRQDARPGGLAVIARVRSGGRTSNFVRLRSARDRSELTSFRSEILIPRRVRLQQL